VTRARLGALALIAVACTCALLMGSPASAQVPERDAHIVTVLDASMEDLLASPGFRGLAGSGGAGLMSGQAVTLRDAVSLLVIGDEIRGGPVGVPMEGLTIDHPGSMEAADGNASPDAIDQLAEAIHRDLVAAGAGGPELLLIVASDSPPSNAEAAGDELAGVIVAIGTAEELAAAMDRTDTPAGSLTSDSTRREGVVVTSDIPATVVNYLDATAPDEGSVGSPLEIIEGPPPFELHERYLAQRRMYVPIGTAGGIYLAIVGLGAIAALALGNHVPRNVRRIFGWGCLSVAALATALLAAGHLPDLTYATVVPFVALVTVFGTLAFAPLEHRDVLLIPAGLGIAVLAYFAVEAILAWTAALTPFVGGSELDGGRFYGLPNAFIGLLIGASLWIAQRLRSLAGFALLVAVALFAGLPYLGANLGGGVSLFAAAGLWLAIRERERLGLWRAIGVFVGVTSLGAAVILAAHAVSPFETHVTRFEEQAGGLAGVFEKFGDRLQVGFDLIARNPFALIPVLGLPIAIAAVLRPPTPLRPSLQRSPAWRDAILVTLLAGVVAYLVNDSGPAAAGLAFGLGLGGLLGVSLLSEAGKMGES